jgi:topoisomerase-4 subunit A
MSSKNPKDQLEFAPEELFGSAETEHTAPDAQSSPDVPQKNNPSCLPGKHHVPDGPFRRLVDDNFLQYASYVIRDRAIPNIEDGLKPVQRRILHSLHKNDDGKFIKVANIVGYCMQFHPHGDASIADALVTLANKRYLIEGQGNFGNLYTGDPAAASRYIECRLTQMAREEIFNPDLTRYIPSYDGRQKEPVTLPAKLPLLLMLGADGIAVGLSTRILPHNFCELIQAQIDILQKKNIVILPDFIQGGLMDTSDYDDGNGRVKLRAVIDQKDDTTLVIRQLPYGATTESIIASIEDAARKKKIKIRSISDYTAERIEIEITLTPDADITRTIQSLYAFTQCEMSINSNIVVIKDNRPVQMTVTEVLRANTTQLVKILKRELLLEKKNLLDELHRKTLVQIFVEHRIYKRIEECTTYPDVQQAVLDGVNQYRHLLRRDVTNQDVEMLLAVKIKRISLFDINKNRRETDRILSELDKVEKNLGQLTKYAIRYLKQLLKKYGGEYPRLTTITTFSEIQVRKLTEKTLIFHHDTEKGYIGHALEAETQLFSCSSHDRIVIFWKNGTYKVMNPPEKIFVGDDMLYAGSYHRNTVYTLVYTEDIITYMKRFKLGGAILNKDYSCIPDHAQIILFADDDPEEIYVKYKKAKRQRINQQVFQPGKLAVKSVKTKGIQMTVKTIRAITTRKPRKWDSDESSPRGAVMDFL